jgi:alkaline phosphatase
MKLDSVNGRNSVYRDEKRLAELYGQLPTDTYNSEAAWFDQTDVYRLQIEAVEAGKKYVILVVFDGMDWQTTWAAATAKSGEVRYREGRGSGLHVQDYRGVETDFGYCVTSPHNHGTKTDVDSQTILSPGGTIPGGYDWRRGGSTPWATPTDPQYLLAKSRERPHAYTDSSSSATSLTTGIKTYNDAVNMDWQGDQVETIAHRLQKERGFAIGVVTNVPISHATPAAAYAHNVTRGDYQDLSRDMLGLPSIAHRETPLPGVDVLLGAGWGENVERDAKQGANFVPGNKYLTDEDLQAIDTRSGGPYVVTTRTAGVAGLESLRHAARQAIGEQKRLFGYFGVKSGHLPYRTADGGYNPTVCVKPPETYTDADLSENPTLADMTRTALEVLSAGDRNFWLMVEPGDVDWANHDNNIDNAIGAVFSGDDAVREITRWAEEHHCWEQTALIVTSDHGHFLVLEEPEALIGSRL